MRIMDDPGTVGAPQEQSSNHRRALVKALSATWLACVTPRAHSRADPQALQSFIELSGILVGRRELDAQQAARLYEVLRAQAADFDSDTQALLALIAQRKPAVGRLQRLLDAESSRLAPLPRKIVSAWYTGIVGEDARARCVTYETSLMHDAVKDHLAPPSFCHGPYGSWASKPG